MKKGHDGREFVRSGFVARDFKPRRESEGRLVRGDAAAGGKESVGRERGRSVRKKGREQDQDDAKLMFTVEVPHVFKKFGKFAELKRWLYGMTKGSVRMEE